MKIIFLFIFGYLIYRFLIKPVFIGPAQQQRPRHRNPQQDMLEMMRRMQEYQQRQQYGGRQESPSPSREKPNSPQANKDTGEYIDYEEIE